MSDPKARDGGEGAGNDRRKFLAASSTVAMAAGLAGGYGAFAAIAGRFLYPAKPDERSWIFVAEASRLAPGESLLFRGPSGEKVNLTRQGSSGGAADFIALSSTCPHLGCQVHWESQNERYFCPCHNGTFDAAGVGTGGPPGDAGQSLPRYPLKIEGGLLYMELPVSTLTADRTAGEVVDRVAEVEGPGHDPCLAPRPRKA